MRFVKSKATGRSVPIRNPKLEDWRARIAVTADVAMHRIPPFDGGVVVRANFFFKRPKKHYRTGQYSDILRYDAPDDTEHFQAPDIDKLTRAVLDSLTGVVYHDDKQVKELKIKKRWAKREYTTISVTGTHYLLAEVGEG